MSGARIAVQGRVQGVGYRDWVVGEARALGIDGWVRNRSDGSVEILAIGDPQLVERLAERCREGPRAARVIEVIVELWRQSRSRASSDAALAEREQKTAAPLGAAAS